MTDFASMIEQAETIRKTEPTDYPEKTWEAYGKRVRQWTEDMATFIAVNFGDAEAAKWKRDEELIRRAVAGGVGYKNAGCGRLALERLIPFTKERYDKVWSAHIPAPAPAEAEPEPEEKPKSRRGK